MQSGAQAYGSLALIVIWHCNITPGRAPSRQRDSAGSQLFHFGSRASAQHLDIAYLPLAGQAPAVLDRDGSVDLSVDNKRAEDRHIPRQRACHMQFRAGRHFRGTGVVIVSAQDQPALIQHETAAKIPFPFVA